MAGVAPAARAERLEVNKPCFVYATSTLLMGSLHVMVYRSVRVRVTDKPYKPVAEFIGDTAPLISVIVESDLMMGGKAELSVYVIEQGLKEAA